MTSSLKDNLITEEVRESNVGISSCNAAAFQNSDTLSSRNQNNHNKDTLSSCNVASPHDTALTSQASANSVNIIPEAQGSVAPTAPSTSGNGRTSCNNGDENNTDLNVIMLKAYNSTFATSRQSYYYSNDMMWDGFINGCGSIQDVIIGDNEPWHN